MKGVKYEKYRLHQYIKKEDIKVDIVKSIEHEQLKNKIPELRIGNTVRVHVRIKEGNKERIQVFEGIIIKKQGGGVNATFTVEESLMVLVLKKHS